MKPFRSQVSKATSSAMGVSAWALFLGGAVAGQLVTIVNLGVWLGWRDQEQVELAVKRAVSEVVKECSPSEPLFPTTTTFQFLTTPPPSNPGLHLSFGLWVGASICCLALWTCCLLLIGRWGLLGTSDHSQSPRHKRGLELENLSPPTPSIRDLAQNQLAELRLRRYGADQ